MKDGMNSVSRSTRTSSLAIFATSVYDTKGQATSSSSSSLRMGDNSMESTTSPPSLLKRLIRGSGSSDPDGRRSFISSPLDSLSVQQDIRQSLTASQVHRLANNERVTSHSLSSQADSIVSKATTEVLSLVSRCLNCENSTSTTAASTASPETTSLNANVSSEFFSVNQTEPQRSTSFPHSSHSNVETSRYTRVMNSLISKESLTENYITRSALMTPTPSAFPASDGDTDSGKLFSDPDYGIFIPHDDSDDYLISSAAAHTVSPSSISFWNESVLSIDSEFDNSPSLNFSSLSELFSSSSIADNVSNFDPSDSLAGEQPDFTIHHPFLAIVLGIMCLTVIAGNVLVMLAIRRERNLQTVTNYFVASLSAADCLVGLIVMPFSVVHEVMNKSWIFGQDWCDLWHSFDVLASTASILNLCVISMDRYWAITDPLSYPAKLTSKRAKALIAIVCALLIPNFLSRDRLVASCFNGRSGRVSVHFHGRYWIPHLFFDHLLLRPTFGHDFRLLSYLSSRSGANAIYRSRL